MATSAVVSTSDIIDKVLSKLPDLVMETDHNEIYGVELVPSSSTTERVQVKDTAAAPAAPPAAKLSAPPVKLIVGKFLRAHKNDVDATVAALKETLLWRKEFNPRKAAFEEEHDPKFEGIGYNTVLGGTDVVVWNIYGALQGRANPAELFQPLDKFMRWRVGLMERCIDLLKLSEYTGDGTDDPKQAVQIHDYMNVKFFRMDPNQRATTKQVVDLMSKHYPESMSAKYMINVPLIMSWMMGLMKLLISRETLQKITVMSYGSGLAGYIGHEDVLPKEYGGRSDKSLKEIAEPWVPATSSAGLPKDKAPAHQAQVAEEEEAGARAESILPLNEKPVQALQAKETTEPELAREGGNAVQDPEVVPVQKTTA